ncbi:MAG: PaaI family thioesterase [Sphingomonadales bacterium]|nr:PaaI family thioesterase [Sphingomonadales bacterium]
MGTDFFACEPDPEHPGWLTWELGDRSRYNHQILGKLLIRPGDTGKAWVRMFPERRHSNFADNLHGGTVLGFIDVALFGACRIFDLINAGTAVTLDLSAQFIGAGQMDVPLDAEVELLRETRRLVFLRGLVLQGDNRVAAFSATIRKATAQ